MGESWDACCGRHPFSFPALWVIADDINPEEAHTTPKHIPTDIIMTKVLGSSWLLPQCIENNVTMSCLDWARESNFTDRASIPHRPSSVSSSADSAPITGPLRPPSIAGNSSVPAPTHTISHLMNTDDSLPLYLPPANQCRPIAS